MQALDISNDDLDTYSDAIAAIESEGRGGYGALGPVTKKLDRGYGRYQVMGANIPAWTYMATGKSMTPSEFLNSPETQDAVFKHRFGGYVAKYGNAQDAASVWFTGRPLEQGGAAASDSYITGSRYVSKFDMALEKARNLQARAYAGQFESPSDEEILKRYDPSSPPEDLGPSDEEILKQYNSAPSIAAMPSKNDPEAAARIRQAFGDLPANVTADATGRGMLQPWDEPASGSPEAETLRKKELAFQAWQKVRPSLASLRKMAPGNPEAISSLWNALTTEGNVDKKLSEIIKWGKEYPTQAAILGGAAGIGASGAGLKLGGKVLGNLPTWAKVGLSLAGGERAYHVLEGGVPSIFNYLFGGEASH